MLDEKRIKLMTRMAAYEETQGKKTIPIGNYFRGDYISLNLIIGVLCVTVGYALVAGVYIYYNIETLLSDVYKLDLVGIGRIALTAYIVLIAFYTLISYVIYSVRYDMARKSLLSYDQALRELSDMYDEV